MNKSAGKKALRQRSAWLASMFGCGAFLLMAVKLYNVSASVLLSNLLMALLVLGIIVVAAASFAWCIAIFRKWRK